MEFDHRYSGRHSARQHAWPWLGLVAILLTSMVALQAATVQVDDQSSIDVPAPQPLPVASMPATGAAITSSQRLDKTLARPLFSQDRRPLADTSISVAGPLRSLPRLTGVVVSSAGAVAIFAGVGGGKPVVVGEGGTVGAMVVETVAPGRVTMRGSDGAVVLHPVFDASAKQVTALDPAEPALPGYGPRPDGHHAAFWKAAAAATQPSNSR
jgi:hypothetical protein